MSLSMLDIYQLGTKSTRILKGEATMKLLIAITTGLVLSSAFARTAQVTDIGHGDCQDANSRTAAVKRLKASGLKTSTRKVKKMCKKLTDSFGTQGGGLTRVQQFENYVMHNPVSCFGKGLDKAAGLFGIPHTLAVRLCDQLQKQALDKVESLGAQSVGSDAYSDESLIWWQVVEQIFRTHKIKRNPYISGLRKRFKRAEKPGITPSAPLPHELFNPNVNSGIWFCHIYEPFSGASISGNDSKVFQTLQFDVNAYRTVDDGGYTYDYQNGMEFSGRSSGSDEVLRNIRLEYFCDKQYDDAGARITCTEENSSSRQLLIEESQSVNNFWNVFKNLFVIGDLSVSDDEAIQNFLASQASRSLGDYITENKAKCSSLILDCEVASRYLECTENFDEINQIIARASAAKKTEQ